MSLNETICEYEKVAKIFDKEGADEIERGCAQRYRQLAEWLRELKMYREKEDDGR